MKRIALYGHDEVSLYGTAAILDVEKIPYRRIHRFQDLTSDELLVATGGDLTRTEVARVMCRPALVLNGGATFAVSAFGRVTAAVREQPVRLPVDSGLWPRSMTRRLLRFGHPVLSIPLAPVCEVTHKGNGRPSGILLTPTSAQPAILRDGRCVWSPLDVGAAFSHLLTESYAPAAPDAFLDLLHSASLERGIEAFYYAAPTWLRRRVQTLCYARAERRLRTASWHPSEYPADGTGGVLIELLKGLILLAAGSLVRLARWPAPYRSAALMTHDIEPSRYAYKVGLAGLIQRQRPTDHPVLGLVSDSTRRHLDAEAIARLKDFDVLCHGLTHRGETVSGVTSIARQLGDAKNQLEDRLGRCIQGYRSPRLARSADLLRALDGSDFHYDSSYPDSDRENLEHYGAGVRLNVPYRAPIETSLGTLRRSRCLELPLTAPDCIQPIFAGESEEGLHRTVTRKSQFVRATGGLHVALVHAGVFGDDDAALRERHRQFVARELSAPGTWLPRVRELIDWWRSREDVDITSHGGFLYVTNPGRSTIRGLHVVIEEPDGEQSVTLSVIEPGATVGVSLHETLVACLQNDSRMLH